MPPHDPADPVSHAVLDLYAQGWFPMADPEQPDAEPKWLQPEQRGLIPLHEPESESDASGLGLEPLHVSRRLRQRMRTAPFLVTTDRAFGRVIRACAEPRVQDPDTWIDRHILGLFEHLHAAGHAHSIEVWTGPGIEPGSAGRVTGAPPPEGAVLVGGLYGLAIGGLFCGESMFSRPADGGTDASKIALVCTARHLRSRGFVIFDSQFWNEHLDQFRCQEVDRARYVEAIAEITPRHTPWI